MCVCRIKCEANVKKCKSLLKSHFLWVGVVSAVVVAQEATLRTKIFFAEFSIVDLLKRRENTLSLFGAYEHFLVKFYYCQKVKIEKCYIVRTGGKIIGFIEI